MGGGRYDNELDVAKFLRDAFIFFFSNTFDFN
jgi:hypothetical protein